MIDLSFRASKVTLLAALLVGAGALACGNSPSTGTGTGTGGSGSGSGGGTNETFTDVYTTVIQPNCSSHHAAGAVDGFLDYSSQSAAYKSLVSVKASGPACGSPAVATPETRVVPGQPSQSLLYQKVSLSQPPCGVQMPFNGTPLSLGDQTKIEEWIAAGAQNN